MGEKGLWKRHVRIQDGDLDHSHDQHVRLEDVGTGRNKALRREQEKGKQEGAAGLDQRALGLGEVGLDQRACGEGCQGWTIEP